MKKLFISSGVYTILALIGGVFFREFTKYYEFLGHTSLSVIHTHLFVLGTFLFLLLALLFKDQKLEESKTFKWFFITYNIALPLFIITLLTRGILQVTNASLSDEMNSMISGLAGVTHILLTVSLCLLIPNFIKLVKTYKKER